MSQLVQDLRFAVRTLLRSPVFATVAALTLALGIGANTAIFSVINGVLLKPLEYREPDRLVSIKSQFPTLGFDVFWMSAPEYLDLVEWSRSFESIGGYRTGSTSIEAEGQPLRVSSASVTQEFFVTLGVDAEIGRYFTKEEDLPGGDPAVVISHGLWTRALGADRNALGSTILVNGAPATLVGVMPDGFDIDDTGVEVWRPLQIDPANPGGRASHFLYLVGRLSPGVTLQQARAEIDGFVNTWSERAPDAHTPVPEFHRILLADLQEELVSPVRTALWLLLGAVAFVLLIACANVANLLLARSESRQKEVAVRVALGAPRSRLVRQFLTESLVLALVGAAIGAGLAWVGLDVLLASSSGSLPRLEDIGIDKGVLAATLVVAMATGVLFGLAPVVHLTGGGVGDSLREGGLRSTSTRARRRVRSGLVVAEVALAVMLVVGSGLMLRSLQALFDVDPGFNEENLVTWQMLLPPATYPENEDQARFYTDLTARLSALPRIESAAAMSGLPPRRNVNANDTEFESLEQTDDGPAHNVDYYQWVTANYFDVMEIPTVSGRAFEASDDLADHPVVVINERLGQVFFGDMNPIGQRLRACCGDSTPWFEIVGVAADVKQGGIDEETGTEIYLNYSQTARLAGFAPRNMNVVVRAGGVGAPMANTLRNAVWAMDRSLPLANLQTMEENITGTLARPRFLATLLGVFAALALLLAAVGTYGVISYYVAERDREIGIRMAMGAESGSVLAMVLRMGGGLAVMGLAVGLVGAVALSRVMESLVFGVTTTDPATYILAPTVLAAVALLACYIPARRATRVDPAVVLRAE